MRLGTDSPSVWFGRRLNRNWNSVQTGRHSTLHDQRNINQQQRNNNNNKKNIIETTKSLLCRILRLWLCIWWLTNRQTNAKSTKFVLYWLVHILFLLFRVGMFGSRIDRFACSWWTHSILKCGKRVANGVFDTHTPKEKLYSGFSATMYTAAHTD